MVLAGPPLAAPWSPPVQQAARLLPLVAPVPCVLRPQDGRRRRRAALAVAGLPAAGAPPVATLAGSLL